MKYVLIVAGGKGLRMGCELPKQFLPIGGKPVLMRTIEAFYAYSPEIRIILVLPCNQQATGMSCAGNMVFQSLIKSQTAEKHASIR